jgi:cell division protein FtsB
MRRRPPIRDREDLRSERPYLRQHRDPARPPIPIRRWFLLLALGVAVYEFVFSPRSFIALHETRRESERLAARCEELRVELEKTRELKERLESGEAVEEAAREIHGMARPGEEIYVLPAPEAATSAER